MITKCIQAGIEVALSNHTYWYHSELYRQLKGGALGERLRGVVAHVVMDKWESEIRKALRRSMVEFYLFGKYVDDVNLATAIIPKGNGRSECSQGRKLI